MTRIITPAALQGRSLTELQALYRAIEQELVQTEIGSQAMRVALEGVCGAVTRLRGLRFFAGRMARRRQRGRVTTR